MEGWWVILVIAFLQLVLLFVDLRFLYYFMHEDDLKYNQGILAQVVAILGSQFMWLSLALVPTDAFNASLPGSLNMLYMWRLTYLFVVLLLTVILPYAIFFYEADSDSRLTKTRPWLSALKKTGIATGASWSLIAIFYFILRKVEAVAEDGKTAGKVNVNFLDFLFALTSFVGCIFLIFFAALGLVTVPYTLILKFIKRPHPLNTQQYERHRKLLGTRAQTLATIGEGLLASEERLKKKSKVKKQTATMSLRRKMNKYEQVVSLLENEYHMLETSFTKRGTNPVKAGLTLALGIFCALLSIFWVVQILMVNLILPMLKVDDPTKVNMLNACLVALAKLKGYFPELLLYNAFTVYLIICAAYGSIRMNQRMAGFLPVETLKKHDTHLNAILYHLAVTVLCATAIVALSVCTLSSYLDGTSVKSIFQSFILRMRMIGNFYSKNVFQWALLIFTLISLAWVLAYPKDRPMLNLDDPKVLKKWAELQHDLGVDKDDEGAVHAPTAEELAAAEPTKAPTLADRAKSKYRRFDKGLENAPGDIMRAGLMNKAAG